MNTHSTNICNFLNNIFWWCTCWYRYFSCIIKLSSRNISRNIHLKALVINILYCNSCTTCWKYGTVIKSDSLAIGICCKLCFNIASLNNKSVIICRTVNSQCLCKLLIAAFYFNRLRTAILFCHNNKTASRICCHWRIACVIHSVCSCIISCICDCKCTSPNYACCINEFSHYGIKVITLTDSNFISV